VPALIQGQKSKKFLSALLDTGSDGSFIHSRCIPPGVELTKVEPRAVVGLHQSQQYNLQATLENIVLPELCSSKSITKFDFLVSNHDTSPDIILGNDFLSAIGLNPDPVSATIKWFDHVIPWKHYKDLPKAKFNIIQAMMLSIEEQWDLLEETNTVYQKGPILIQESKYTKVDPDFVAAQQKHLSPQQQADLAALLHQFPELFNGQLGHYPHRKVHLELNALPYACDLGVKL